MILPGFFDLHAHYAVDLRGEGRVDETEVYPTLFLANGVTSTFPAREVQPEKMRDLRLRIEAGDQAGPRLFNSGPASACTASCTPSSSPGSRPPRRSSSRPSTPPALGVGDELGTIEVGKLADW